MPLLNKHRTTYTYAPHAKVYVGPSEEEPTLENEQDNPIQINPQTQNEQEQENHIQTAGEADQEVGEGGYYEENDTVEYDVKTRLKSSLAKQKQQGTGVFDIQVTPTPSGWERGLWSVMKRIDVGVRGATQLLPSLNFNFLSRVLLYEL